jgi:cell fate (sporulation/competence/biofilm development) regulator YmcA (YheA/YmcA/DUF963 family)
MLNRRVTMESRNITVVICCLITMLTTSALSETNNVVNEDDLFKGISSPVKEWLKANVDSNIVAVIVEQSGASEQLAALQEQAEVIDVKIREKKNELTAIQQKIDMLRLKPSELAIVEKYNHSIVHEPDFLEWIQTKVTWFEVIKDFLISALFFCLGGMWDKYGKTSHKKT